ncbi:polysaccharide biosynthesis protein [Altericroceibacterium xinjiangense]|uniref:polysaccharide biosynthesis protein n=1 Tax=Altericroceibacterium xinjiangense TaxID=762261 RepID=UPI000F7E1190|nr:nucleoside-diphosphate sugar epimerase/dehydratase [Altericroceibacterium xinjiangense]
MPDFRQFSAHLIGLPRNGKRAIALVFDGFLLVTATWLAFYLRIGKIPDGYDLLTPIGAALILALPIFVRFGLYRAIFRYSGWSAALMITKAVAAYGAVYFLIFTIYGVPRVPRTIGLLQPIVVLLLVAASRILVQRWLSEAPPGFEGRNREPGVLIYGAGSAGRQLASAITDSRAMRLIGYLDDDPQLIGGTVNGLPVFAGTDVGRLVERFEVADVLLAMPSCSRARRAAIVEMLKNHDLRVKTLPAVLDIARGKVSIGELHEVDVDDLLGRLPITPDEALMRRNIEGKVVLVTGAGGSIGQEICRQITRYDPAVLLLIDSSEYALYAIELDLQKRIASSGIQLVPLLASVRDRDLIESIMAEWRPSTIFHAAAYKHVPLVEANIAEGIANNTFGTRTVAELAVAYEVENFVLISTDKAVRPTNVMGASKRAAENVLQAMAALHPVTCFSMVRFGNVLGSSGSVVPLFRSQILDGGPITLTHLEMTRYFMTIPEAAQLVIQAGAMATGGDVFVLDMGEPVRILDLARNMVALSGLTLRDEDNPDGDIEIRVTGLRPGEKLYEELLIGNNPIPSSHPRILRAREGFIPQSELDRLLAELQDQLAHRELREARATLKRIVPEFTPERGRTKPEVLPPSPSPEPAPPSPARVGLP